MSQADSHFIACTNCETILDITGFTPGDAIECPHCRQTVVIPEPGDPDDDLSRYAELNTSRIQQIAKLRSATYRSRSHAMIAMFVCAVAIIESIAYLIRDWMHAGVSWRLIAPLFFAVVGIAGTVFFARRATELNRDLR